MATMPQPICRRGLISIALSMIVFVLAGVLQAQQQAIAHRRTILRTQAAATGASNGTVEEGAPLTLLSPTPSHGFYHVRMADGREGWLGVKSVDVEASDEPSPAPAASPDAGGSFQPDWDKPPVTGSTFTGPEGSCGPGGDPHGDTATDSRKNRIDVPSTYHQVTWNALAQLGYPVAGKTRDTWTPAQLQEIAPYEGVAVTVEGYVVAIKNQNKAPGESTNCHFYQAVDVDWHVALVESVGDGEKTAVVVETTPRMRKVHPKWTIQALTPWLNADKPVRISGWTLLDPEHRNDLNRYRSTLWEIHPITKIEVWDGSQWVDLDTKP